MAVMPWYRLLKGQKIHRTNFFMSFAITWAYCPLKFKFPAGTSRGVLHEKESYIIRLSHPDFPERVGFGEVSVLPGLSPELTDPNWIASMHHDWRHVQEAWKNPLKPPRTETLSPAFAFALECAWAGWTHATPMTLFPSQSPPDGFAPLAINGLIWMGDADWMEKQIEEKLQAGFTTLKMKVGALDLATELRLLARIRSAAPASELTLRVDANGAFSPKNARSILDQLAKFDIHSIEQPIAAGQRDAMSQLIQQSPIPIALDEELIGIRPIADKEKILTTLNPHYIILKPSLHGGVQSTREWISAAENQAIGWWMTSALESNVGLHAICQLTATYQPSLPQGLGTGSLYENNIPSPLNVRNGQIQYDVTHSAWDFSALNFQPEPVNSLL